MKKFYSLVMTALALLVTQNVFAGDPDLSGYTAIKTMDFSKATYASDVNITLSSTQYGTAYETGNKQYQKIYEVATPEDLQGYLALQGVYPKKGWWIRSTKGGLYSISAQRSGAVINLKKDYVVAFNCTQDAENVMSLVNDKGNPDGSFTYEKSEDTKTYYATMTADGQVNFCGNKTAGYISSIVVYAPGTVVVQPTAAYTAVNGTSRTVTFTGANLAYNTDGSDTYTNFKDGEGNNVNKADVTVSETTTYYVVSTNGEQKSDVLEFTIEAGTELTLATPVASITKMGEGFARTYSVVCNNKDVLLTPTAKLTYDFTPSGEGEAESGVECDGTIEATVAGTYVVTASAEGYTSTTITIDNTKEYELTKTIDLTTLKAENLSTNWKKKAEGVSLPGSDTQWLSKYGDIVADKYFYDFSAESASATDVLAGLNVEINKEGKAPVLFTGFGMMYPIYQMNAEGDDNTDNKVAITDGKLSIVDGTADQVGVYTYINNYGKNGTKTAVVAGDKEFALYRFSDMLTKVEIYSPKKEVIDTPVIPEGDVTATYLVNPGFEDCEAATGRVGTSKDAQGADYETVGWKLVSSSPWSNSAAFAYGSDASLNDAAVPAADNAGNTGKALGFTVGWGGTNSYQSTNEVVLPAGYYTMKAHAYNGGTATQFASKLGFATANNTYTSTKNSFALNEWVEDVVEFSLESETTGHFTIGGAAISGGSPANGKVFFDNITLEHQDLLSAAKNNLAKEIAVANEIVKAGIAPTTDLLAAIATAEAAKTKTDYKEILAAIESLKAAVAAYKDVNAHFVAFDEAKAKYATIDTQYASAEKIAAVKTIAEKTPATADEADALKADYIKAVRSLVESNALAEGVDGKVDYTSKVTNPKFTDGVNDWDQSQEKKGSARNDQTWTNADGTNGGNYYDYWNGSANNQRVSQEVANLTPGKYIVTVKARAEKGFWMYLRINDKNVTDIEEIGDKGGIFERGWNDYTAEFTVGNNGKVKIEVGNIMPSGQNKGGWFSFGDVRLVRLGDLDYVNLDEADNNIIEAKVANVTLNRTLKADKWNTLVLPFAVSADEVKATFGDGVSIATYSNDEGAVINFTTTQDIKANVPVLIKPTKINKANDYTFKGVTLVEGTPVAKGNMFDYVGCYVPCNLAANDYMLSDNQWWKNGETSGYKVKGFRAYVQSKSPQAAKQLTFVIDGQTTGLKLNTITGNIEGETYNMAGQRVANGYKGLVIKNGKKVINK